jgi:hypothetical protein
MRGDGAERGEALNMTGPVGKDLDNRIFVAALIASLIVRLLLAYVLRDVHPSGDPHSNEILAQTLLHGGFAVDHYIYGKHLQAMYPPLYPALLGLVGAVAGISTFSISFLNTAIDLGVAWTLLRLAKVVDQPGGALAAAAYLLWPALLLAAPVAQKEGLVTLLALQIVHLFAIAGRGDRLGWRRAIGVGVATGLLALTQPALILLPIGLALALVRRLDLRVILRNAAIAIPAAIAMLMPWWVRNWVIFHAFVPLTTSGGYSLMVVLNGGHITLPAGIISLPEPDRSARIGSIAVQQIFDHPLSYAKGVARGLAAAWFKGSFAHERLQNYPRNLILPWAIINLAQLGFVIWTGWLRPNRLLLLLVLGALLALLPNIFLEFSERHRQFLLPLLFLISAPTLRDLAQWRPTKRGYSVESKI